MLVSISDPESAKKLFLILQLAFAGAILALIYFASRRRNESFFRVREADSRASSKKTGKNPARPDPLAEARIKRSEPLRLSGIRIDGEPHEILGISPGASTAQIQNAYRELMKRYHPDIVGRPGSREWEDAQKIAEAINRARNQMLASQAHNPNRSGR